MTDPGGVSAVLGRISGIEARFAPPVDPPGTAPAAPPPVDGFEPFGEVYERAVAARPVAEVVAVAPPRSVEVGAGFRSSSVTPSPYLPTHVTAAIEGRAGAPGARPIGGYGAMPVPAELARFGNGRIPSTALGRVEQAGSRHRLHEHAAASWNHLVEAARDAGHELRITDSYRSYDQQVDLAERKGLYREGGFAAVPGTSNHGWGLAVDADVTDPAVQEWLRVNAPRFGWVEAVPREPWHWEFRPHQV